MINWNILLRSRLIAVGLFITVPFIAAGILSMVLFYSQADIIFDWSRDSVVFFIFILLCWIVYYAASRQLPYSKKNVIDDLLLSSLFHLGLAYRINIMELRTSAHNAFASFFEMTYAHGYSDPSKYKEKITIDLQGASQAFKDRKVIYLPQTELCTDIDPDIKHLWSAPIMDLRGDSVAVLNIDNIAGNELTADIIEHNKKSIEQLANLIAFYWRIPE